MTELLYGAAGTLLSYWPLPFSASLPELVGWVIFPLARALLLSDGTPPRL